MRIESGLSLTITAGSPNGLAIGYFLNQHKRQLGGNKFVWEISVFLGDKGVMSNPNILFKVDTGTHAPSFQDPKGKQKKVGKKKSKLRRKVAGLRKARCTACKMGDGAAMKEVAVGARL